MDSVRNPNFKVEIKIEEKNYGKFIIEPLSPGFGHTLGNALRRVLLSALPGAAVVTVKIDGIRHQFSTLAGLKEDVIELILNIKALRVKLLSGERATLHLSASGPGEVHAEKIETPPEVEIINQDLYMGSLSDKKSRLEVDLQVETGYGYTLAEEKKISTLGVIPIDAIFTPVTRVNYKVEETRVGRVTNLDRLVLEVWTDGTISPREALGEAAKILTSYFLQVHEPKVQSPEEGIAITPSVTDEILKMSVEELDLPTRIYNSLRNGGIETVGQLLGTPKKELTKIRNMGAKSIAIIEEKLREKGVALTV